MALRLTLSIVSKLVGCTFLLFEFYPSLTPFGTCQCKDGSPISGTAIILLEALFFSILTLFLNPTLFYRFVRLQGLHAVINQMVPEMTGKQTLYGPVEECMLVYI